MSFLAPLYLLGSLGLALPVLLHLIRRKPPGRQAFSSLMFLAPTPPRLTRRSRLDQLLLLLLRCAALLLFALAFARPFFREAAGLVSSAERQRCVVLLLDTSASMRRDGLWQAAVDRAERFLNAASAADHIALVTFDDRTTVPGWKQTGLAPSILGEDAGDSVGRAAPVPFSSQPLTIGLDSQPGRAGLVRQQLADVQPGWGATDLGSALATAADMLDAAADAQVYGGTTELLIVLISDLQRGSDVTALQTFDWPTRVRLQIERVVASEPTNVGLQPLAVSIADVRADDKLQLRVINDTDSIREQFRILPAGSDAGGLAEPVYVPPGQSRVVRVPAAGGSGQVTAYRIEGDSHEFDNTAYVAPRIPQRHRVVYVGRDDANDPEQHGFFLRLALASTPQREIDFVAMVPEAALPADQRASLIVVADPPGDTASAQIERFLQSGGQVLLVVRDEGAVSVLQRWLGTEPIAVEQPQVGDYALLGEIDWRHPLFSAFSGPRYADFTKIHFWDYRRLQLPDQAPIDVLARFDRGDIAVCQRTFPGNGRLTVLTSGWNPRDSQLALSTKFVPLLWGLLPDSGLNRPGLYRVGQPVQLPEEFVQAGSVTVQRPDGTVREMPAGDSWYRDTDQPGIYRAAAGEREYPFAVQIAAAESRTAPLETEELEELGVLMAGTSPGSAEKNDRQMRDVELEGQQRWWRWLIGSVIALLLAETYFAGRAARTLPATA